MPIVTNSMETWHQQEHNAIVFEQTRTREIHGKKIQNVMNSYNLYGARIQERAIDLWIDAHSIYGHEIAELETKLNMKFRFLAANVVPIEQYKGQPHIVQVLSFTDRMPGE